MGLQCSVIYAEFKSFISVYATLLNSREKNLDI